VAFRSSSRARAEAASPRARFLNEYNRLSNNLCRSAMVRLGVMWKRNILLILVAYAFSAIPSVAASGKPIWAKAATNLHPGCDRVPPTPQLIFSPDGKVRVEVLCRAHGTDEDPSLYLRITLPGDRSHEIGLEKGSNELLWAPDSKAFFVNGGDTAISGFFVSVYRIENDAVTKLDVTGAAQRDMVTSFPPCNAYNRDGTLCKTIEHNPEYNMSGISWMNDSSALVVMAEVPCSGEYGGIMCQVLGYKLDAETGRILQRMTAHELKKRWQRDMAWQLRIPDPPRYGAPYRQP
jgi:hypothetical protein